MLVDSILHRLGTFKSHCSNYLCCNFYVPNLCRMLAYRYMQAFYTDWVHCVYPICVECLHIGICKHSTQIGYIKFGILHKLGTFFHIFEVSKMCPICVECLCIHINDCFEQTS